MGPRSPKILPKSLQPDPPGPLNVAKTLSSRSIFDFRYFLKYRSQDHQKWSRYLPKWPQDGILAPTWKLLPPSWFQVGAILPHLGEILVDPSPAKINQNQPRQLLRDFLSQGRPQELPDPLQTSIFQVFRSIFLKVFVNF